MDTININGVDYELDQLSEEAKAQIAALQLVGERLVKAEQEVAILQTARNAYAQALAELLPSEEDDD
jgi:hypothetical protein